MLSCRTFSHLFWSFSHLKNNYECSFISFSLTGKVYVPKEPPKIESIVDEEVQTEWDDILSKATEEELVDLAGMISTYVWFALYY